MSKIGLTVLFFVGMQTPILGATLRLGNVANDTEIAQIELTCEERNATLSNELKDPNCSEEQCELSVENCELSGGVGIPAIGRGTNLAFLAPLGLLPLAFVGGGRKQSRPSIQLPVVLPISPTNPILPINPTPDPIPTTPTAVPEPSTILGSLLIGGAILRRKLGKTQ